MKESEVEEVIFMRVYCQRLGALASAFLGVLRRASATVDLLCL